MDTLPPEILVKIVELFDKGQWRNMSLVSKTCYRICESEMYRLLRTWKEAPDYYYLFKCRDFDVCDALNLMFKRNDDYPLCNLTKTKGFKLEYFDEFSSLNWRFFSIKESIYSAEFMLSNLQHPWDWKFLFTKSDYSVSLLSRYPEAWDCMPPYAWPEEVDINEWSQHRELLMCLNSKRRKHYMNTRSHYTPLAYLFVNM